MSVAVLRSVEDGVRKATPTIFARTESSSEAAALGGKKALTPIIAGSICGGVLFILWGIGFAVYFRKRYRRKQRNRLIALGRATPRDKDLQEPKEKIVIPPDPAVLLGQRQPGEAAFPERQNSKDGHHRLHWSRQNSRNQTSNQVHAPGLTPQDSTSPNTVEESTEDELENGIVDEMTVPIHVQRGSS